VEEIARVVERIRARWLKTRITLRADSGFAREALMSWCEQHRVNYVFGLARNTRLVGHIATDLAWAEHDAEREGRPARRFADFRWTTQGSWSRRRRVVAPPRACCARPFSRSDRSPAGDRWPSGCPAAATQVPTPASSSPR